MPIGGSFNKKAVESISPIHTRDNGDDDMNSDLEENTSSDSQWESELMLKDQYFTQYISSLR